MFAVPNTYRWWQLIKWFSFEDVDYDTRATSLALESNFARAEDVFPKVGIRFLESNIIDERGRLCTLVIMWEMIPMGHIMRQSTSECRVSILCCRPSRYTYLPHQTQTTRDCQFGAIWLMYIAIGDSLGFRTKNSSSLWIWKNSTLTGHCRGQPQASESKLKRL